MTREQYDKLRHRAAVLRALADDPGAAGPEAESARAKLAEIEAELAGAQVEPEPASAWQPSPCKPFAPAPPRQPSTPSSSARRGYDVRDDIPFIYWGGRVSTAPRAAPEAEPPPPPPPPPPTDAPPPSAPASPVGHYGVPSAAGAPRRGGPGNGPFGGGGSFGGGGIF